MTAVVNDITVAAPVVLEIAVVGTQGPSGILSLTGEAIADAGGALESDLAKRAESYVQASSPVTDAPALWFDTSNPSFLTIKIQRG